MRLAILILAACLPVSATTYYVANAGSDAANGTSTGTPWQTIAHVNAATLAAGDSVLFNRGDLWRETLTPGQSGSAGSPITFGAYGSGALPVLDESEAAVWAAVTPNSGGETADIFVTGAETGNTSDWGSVTVDAGNGFIATTAAKDHQAYGYRATFGGTTSQSYGTYSWTGGATLYARCYFRLSSNFTYDAASRYSAVLRLQSGGSTIFQFAIGTSSANTTDFTLYEQSKGSAAGWISANSGVITKSVWHYVEVYYKRDATVGGFTAWFDGGQVATSLTRNTSAFSTSMAVAVGHADAAAGVTHGIPTSASTIDIDDAKLSSTGPIGAYAGGVYVAPNVWSAAVTTDPHFPLFGNSPGILQASVSEVTAANNWYWDGSGHILYVYSVTDPTASVRIPTRNYAIYLNGKSYITIDGLGWRGAWALGGGLFAVGGSSHVVITNSTAELNYAEGIMFYDASNIQTGGTISSNTVRYNGAGGINVNNLIGTNWVIHANEVYSNGALANSNFAGSGFVFVGGIYLFDSSVTGSASTGGSGTVVSSNYVHGNGPNIGTPLGDQGCGIWMDSLYNVTVTQNIALDNASSGIVLEKNMGSTMSYNVARNNGNAITYTGNLLLLVSGETTAIKSNNNLVAHNTSYGGYYGLALNVQTSTGTVDFSNNQVFDNIAVSAVHENFLAQPGATNEGVFGSGNTYGYNNFGAAASNFIGWNTWVSGAPVYTDLSTYAAFDSAYGSSTHSVAGDPLLTSPLTGDFTLQPGSPAIRAGVYIPGVSTKNPPDIGALQTPSGGIGALMFSIP